MSETAGRGPARPHLDPMDVTPLQTLKGSSNAQKNPTTPPVRPNLADLDGDLRDQVATQLQGTLSHELCALASSVAEHP